MIIEDSFSLPVPPPRAAEILADIDSVARCVPGLVDIEETETDRYKATLGVPIGPVKPLFVGRLQLDRSESPRRLSADAEGTDRSTGSVAQVAFTAELQEETNQGTLVQVSADVRIRGRLGQYGTGVIQSAAKEVMNQFASCVQAELGTSTEPESKDAPTGPSIGKVIWAVIRDFLRRLIGGRGERPK